MYISEVHPSDNQHEHPSAAKSPSSKDKTQKQPTRDRKSAQSTNRQKGSRAIG